MLQGIEANIEVKPEIKSESKAKKKSTAKANKEKITKSFGELIMDYRREGYSSRESIEKAYSKMHGAETKPKKTTPKKKKKINEISEPICPFVL